MKTLFRLIPLLLACLPAAAQDQLFKRDNSKLEVKVLEITPAEIKYKLFTYQDGPTITVNKSDVVLIIYQNGQHEVFNTVPARSQEPLPEKPKRQENINTLLRREKIELKRQRAAEMRQRLDSITTTKNWVSLNMLELVNGGVSIGYMREFFHNHFDATAQVGVGFVNPTFSNLVLNNGNYNASNYSYVRKAFEVLGGVNFHTNNTRLVTHFVGPMFGFAQFNGRFTETYYTGGGKYYYVDKQFVKNRYTLYVNNGLLFHVTKHLNCSMNLALGLSDEEFVSAVQPTKNKYNTSYDDSPEITHVKLGFNIGYRF